MSDFPRMLYRDGSAVEVWGKAVDTLIVDDGDEMERALANGWRLRPDKTHPLDHDGDGKPGGSRPRRGKARKEAAWPSE